MPKVRRKFFVSKRLQGFFALYLALTIVVMSLFLGMEFLRSYFAVFGFQMGEGGGSVSIPFISETSPFAEPLGEIDVVSLIKVALLVLWGALCVGISYILAANKFTGPIYRLNMTMKKVAAGDFSIRVRFRARDEAFHEVAANFNLMMDAVHNNVKKDISVINDLEEKLEAIPKDYQGLESIKSLLTNWKQEKKKLVTPQEQPAKTRPAKG